MNEGIRYEDIKERLETHVSESLDEMIFSYIFPDIDFYVRADTDMAVHIGDWFHIEEDTILQVSAYTRVNDDHMRSEKLYLLIEPILIFDEEIEIS